MELTKYEQRQVKRVIMDLGSVDYPSWDYLGGEKLACQEPNLEITLENTGQMTDPVAVCRPQTLFSYYGEARVGKSKSNVLLIVGTDYGLGDPDIRIGTIEKLRKVARTRMFRMIKEILPEELTR